MKKIKKYFEYATSLISRAKNEKKYYWNDIVLKYMYYSCRDSSDLVVIFSACTREGISARYNYIRTLNGIKANRLYILDDSAEDRRGSYYLGKYPDYLIEQAVKELIHQYINHIAAGKVIFVGSSKGGWSALNFAAELAGKVSAVIIGAPQYYLGKYLSAPANLITLNYVGGEHIPEAVNELNNHLKKKMSNIKNVDVYLHYSINEHTYVEHIKDMIVDLEKFTNVYVDIKKYADHQEVSLYFPEYLKSTIVYLLEE